MESKYDNVSTDEVAHQQQHLPRRQRIQLANILGQFSPDVDHLDVVGVLNPGLLVPGELRIHRQSISAVEEIVTAGNCCIIPSSCHAGYSF
jgi:hypothetical protein